MRTSIQQSRELADAVNALNATRMARAESLAGFLVAVVVGILAALALIRWATPCAAGSLCLAAVAIPTRTGWLSRARTALRSWRLRIELADVSAALVQVEEDIEDLPQIRRDLRRRRDVLCICLADIELAARKA